MTDSTAPIRHVAIIMDGNGRWANLRSHRRIWGHVRGTAVISEIVEECQDQAIKALTLYAFSTENWSRPLLEVKTLFKLLTKYIRKERKRIIREDICFKVIGDYTTLPLDARNLISELENETKENHGMLLTFAFGYGGRAEIVAGINTLLKSDRSEISEEEFSKYIMNSEAGDVDLLIRTGGDQRISNFLLWQMAYAELFFTKTMWPDFSREEFREICGTVCKRQRRFGSISGDSSFEKSKVVAESNKKIIKEAFR